MTTVADFLLLHGVDLAEHELADATAAGLEWVLTTADSSQLPAADAAVLDDAGLVDVPGAYAESAVATAGAYAAMVGTALTVGEAARLLGISEGRVRHRIAGRDLLVLPAGRRRLPRWQFTEDSVLPGLPKVLHALPAGEHPLAVLAFMTTPQPELVIHGRAVSPRDWLAAGGDPEPVAELGARP